MMGDNSSNFDGTMWFVGVKGMKKGTKEEPFLQVSEMKPEGGFKVHDQTYTKTSGRITAIYMNYFEFEGKKINKLNIDLEDEDPEKGQFKFKFSVTLGGAARELINKLSSVANKGKLDGIFTIGTYMATNFAIPNTTTVIDEMRGLYLHQDGEKVAKAYSYDQLKDKTKQVIVNGETINDYSELNAFYMKVVTDILAPAVLDETEQMFSNPANLGESHDQTPPQEQAEAASKEAPANTQEPEWLNQETEPVDDLPF